MSSFADHPLAQLTLVRFREFIREPEALFWVFIFPVILAAGLGVAFRNRPAEVLQIVTVNEQLAAPLRQEKLLAVQQMTPAAAEQALRTGKAALLVRARAWRLGGDIDTTTAIPKAAPRACWPTALSSAPPDAPTRWPPAIGWCASPDRATSTF